MGLCLPGLLTLSDIVKEVPLIGGLAGEIVDSLGGAVTGLLGGSPDTAETSSEPKFGGDSMTIPSIETTLPFPRHIDFLRTLTESRDLNEAVSKVILQLQNVSGVPITRADGKAEVTVRPMLLMRDRSVFGRAVFDREVDPPTVIPTTMYLDAGEVGYLITRLSTSSKPEHHRMAYNAVGHMAIHWKGTSDESFPQTIFYETPNVRETTLSLLVRKLMVSNLARTC